MTSAPASNARALPVLRGLLAACAGAVWLAVAGCGGDAGGLVPEDESPPAATSPEPEALIGSWLLQTPECDQRLILRGDGTFTLAARVRLAGASRVERASGSYALEPAGDGSGLRLRATAVEAPEPTAPVYCDQWRQRSETRLDFAGIAADTGIEPGALELRSEVSGAVGRVTVGSDAGGSDRLVLLESGAGELAGYLLSEAQVTPSLYHAPFADPARRVEEVGAVAVLPVPAGGLSGVFPDVVKDEILLKWLLNVTSAVELRAAPVADSELPGCNLVIYGELAFTSPVLTLSLAGSAEPQLLALNPNDPADPLVAHPVMTPQGESTAYLAPATFEAPDGGGCSLALTARPQVVRFVEDAVAADSAPSFALAPPGPEPQRTESGPGDAARLVLEPFAPQLVRGTGRLLPSVVAVLPLAVNADGEAPHFDLLDLVQAGQAGAIATLEDGALSLFRDGGTPGLGPFHRHERPAPAATVTPPEAVQATLETDGATQAFRIEVAAAARLHLWSEGGLALGAALRDRDGLTLAENRHGAPDGLGFALVRTLAAGDYDLVVRAAGGAGSYTLRAETAAVPFPDDALAACAIEAGWAAGGAVEQLACRNRGVASLAGLDAFPALKRLSAGRNRIADLAPLAALGELRELSLEGNAISDITALAGLAKLLRLSLAANPLALEQLAVLETLAAGLSHLDLTGVDTLSVADAATLRQGRPQLVLILPDGTVLD